MLYQGVTHYKVTVPMDGGGEVRIVAPGYQPWAVRPRGGGTGKVLSGPVELVR